jgi:CHAD domain-containing protein
MTTDAATGSGATPLQTADTRGLSTAPEHFPEPTAAMVLHRVLAMSARTFLLNDMGDELVDDESRAGTLEALTAKMGTRPLWAQSALESLEGTERRQTETDRIHQSRVAMRRTRSNLRTFRLVFDPSWSTALRAELAWYGDRLGESRDLHILRGIIGEKGPDVMDTEQVDALGAVVTERLAKTMAEIANERGKARRFQLTEQMMGIWDRPHFKAKATKPAEEVLPPLLARAWHDMRGAASKARKKPTDANLHKLRIRMKDLRYGCETVALIEGSAARKTARAAEKLQTQLGDLHDAVFSIDWFEALAIDRPDLADPIDELISVQEDAATKARKGWKKELKEVERRWRRWRG